MSKPIEKLKKQLMEISEVVNAFRSEAVQVKIVDKLLDAMIAFEKNDPDGIELFNKKTNGDPIAHDDETATPGRKKPGATKVLNQLVTTDFFNEAQSISSIAEHCKTSFDSDFKTSELSGILLKLANENKLKRQRNYESNRFEYVKS